jgi:hypothetical protein
MANPRTISQQFLSVLTDTQRGTVREYYRLITDPSIPPDVVIKRISEIWALAEEDITLQRWLECIDFILEEDDNEQDENNKRAYLSEYLSGAVEQLGNKDTTLSQAQAGEFVKSVRQKESVTLLLQCPDKKNHVFVSLEDMLAFCTGRGQGEHTCKECNCKLSEHQVICPEHTVVK